MYSVSSGLSIWIIIVLILSVPIVNYYKMEVLLADFNISIPNYLVYF